MMDKTKRFSSKVHRLFFTLIFIVIVLFYLYIILVGISGNSDKLNDALMNWVGIHGPGWRGLVGCILSCIISIVLGMSTFFYCIWYLKWMRKHGNTII